MKKRICDVCKKEVEDFAGSLSLRYTDSDYTGCAYPAGVVRKEICINCCRKLDNIIMKALEEN